MADNSLQDAIEGDLDYMQHLSRGARPALASWAAWKGIEAARRRHESGDQWAIWTALDACARHGLAIPVWAQGALVAGLDAIREGRAKGLGEAFPAITRKGGQAHNHRQHADEVATAYLIAERAARRDDLEANAVADAVAEIWAIRMASRPNATAPSPSSVRAMIREGAAIYGALVWRHTRNNR